MVGSSKKQQTPDSNEMKGPRSELSTLDFGAGGADVQRALAECADKMEVHEGADDSSAIAEEAAVLYANGQNDAAAAVLEVHVTSLPAGQGEFMWMMLLDLYKLTGMRAEFDEHVIEYARSFEKSPPPWDVANTPVKKAKTSTPSVALGSSLNEQVAKQFDRVRETARKHGTVKIDLSRLRSADEVGAEMLRSLIHGLRKEGIQVKLAGCASMAAMLGGQVTVGQPENRSLWLLLLDMLQHTDDMDRFEEVAVDYAVTFEESPPSWEPPAMEDFVSTTDVSAAAPEPQGFALEGDLLGASAEGIRNLVAFASDHAVVNVDCSRLRRVDFVAAGSLFNVLATLQGQGKNISLNRVNAMVAALLRVMGIDQVCTLQWPT